MWSRFLKIKPRDGADWLNNKSIEEHVLHEKCQSKCKLCDLIQIDQHSDSVHPPS